MTGLYYKNKTTDTHMSFSL